MKNLHRSTGAVENEFSLHEELDASVPGGDSLVRGRVGMDGLGSREPGWKQRRGPIRTIQFAQSAQSAQRVGMGDGMVRLVF
jgi:hypothetical protein